jgi:CheY-like chemotaxis protein
MTENEAAGREAMSQVVAVVKDLFFVARIRETARGAGVPLSFARSPGELETALASPVALVLMDLTMSNWDYSAFFETIARVRPRPAVVAYTTHVLAGVTKPWHGRCDRVVTKETLTEELAQILRSAGRPSAESAEPPGPRGDVPADLRDSEPGAAVRTPVVGPTPIGDER